MRTATKRKIVDLLMTITVILSCTILGLSIVPLIPEEEVAIVAEGPVTLEHINAGVSLQVCESDNNGIATLAYNPESNWRVIDLANVIGTDAERNNDEVLKVFDANNSRSASMSAMNTETTEEVLPMLIPINENEEEGKPIDHTEEYFGMKDYTEEELFYVAAEIWVESRGEPYNGKVAVGATIVNRVMHPDFPDTIYSVIIQEGQYASIYGVTKEMIDQVPECWEAAIEALNGIDPTYELTGEHALYFYNPAGCSQYLLNARANIKNTCTIGAHIFYRNW